MINTYDWWVDVCFWPDHGGWEFINSHGAITFVSPVKLGIVTEACRLDDVFPIDELSFGSDNEQEFCY